MNKRPWYPRYTADIRRKTSHLSAECFGCYDRLLDHYWDNNGNLEFDPAGLCRIMGVDRRRFNHIWRYLKPFWVIVKGEDGDTLLQERLQEELEKTIAISKVKSESGKKGGQASASAKQQAKINTPTPTLTNKEKSAESAPDGAREKVNFWDVAESIGIPRSVVGKACKTHTETAVATAIATTQIKSPADPKAFFLGLLKANPKNGAQPDWQRVPYDDDQLWPWAKKHGYGDPGNNENYNQYRNRLKALVGARKDKEQTA